MTNSCRLTWVSAHTCVLLLVTSAPAQLRVDADFPGGSAAVETIDQQTRTIRLNPFPHPDRGWACWWYCKVDGVTPGTTVRIDVGEAPWATPDRASFSYDRTTWHQTSPGQRIGKRITYTLAPTAAEFWIAWGPPFLAEDAAKLLETASRRPFASTVELCRTREDRPTPALVVNETDGRQDRYGIWIQARQHAWESGSSWVAKGFVEWLISDQEAAKSLRRRAKVVVVPIMDVDNVCRGAGGKNQKPQDHNRDWSASPHWPSVAAAQQAISEWDQSGQFDLFVDLHNPSAHDREPYYYVPPDDLLSATGRRNLQRFIAVSKQTIVGPLRFAGKVIASGAEYDPNAWQAISKNWVTMNSRDHVVAVTLETAWNTPASTTTGYQRVGRELGMAIDQYFRSAVRNPAAAGQRP